MQTNLQHLSRAADGVPDTIAIVERASHALLAVYRPAAVESGDHMLGMKRERCGDHDGVDVARLKQLAVIGVSRGLLAGHFAAFGNPGFVDVAQTRDAHAGNAQHHAHHMLSAAADSDDTEVDPIAGSNCLRRSAASHAQRQSAEPGRGHSDKLTSFHDLPYLVDDSV